MCINAKAMPINKTCYSCNETVLEFVYLIIWSPDHAISLYIIPLVIKSLGVNTHTHMHTQTCKHVNIHTDFPDKNKYKKLGTCQPQTSIQLV